MNKSSVSHKHHRFLPQIIAHAVWLYFRLPLSLRLVEEMLLERGIVVSYETIRRWGKKFGPGFVRRLRRKKPCADDVWHLDEAVITIGGQKRRNTKAAKRLLTRLSEEARPGTQAYRDRQATLLWATKRQVMPNVEHWSHKGLNNRSENSHIPLRKRERAMQDFRSPAGLQRFSSIFSAVRNHFVPPRSKRSAFQILLHRLTAMAEWKAVTAA